MIKPCCVWLERMLLNAGESGICVVALRDGDVRQFFLQARPLTRYQARNWGLLMAAEPLSAAVAPLFRNESGGLAPLHTLMRVPLAYCPHCGRDSTGWRRHMPPSKESNDRGSGPAGVLLMAETSVM
jgi:hypothetical protein